MTKEIALAGNRAQLVKVLQSSLYVGSKDESVEMVLDYCEAAGFDPMQKPVHIVPINAKNPVTGNYEWRDVVMPGIGLYRIQADRSKSLAGISEPVFGEMIRRDFRDKNGNAVSVTFPEWCSVTVKKLVGNHIVEFTAKEYWEENYASDSGKSDAPNSMWRKRVRGQIAKCAEAQALRKAFPEVGNAPTAEEMEGKTLESQSQPLRRIEAEPQEYSQEEFDQKVGQWEGIIRSGKHSANSLIAQIESKGKFFTMDQKMTLASFEVPEAQVEEVE
ncbi:MAG: phage recombination protein Bet [Syntrophomonadaceae bacterium]|nr:phage recombination protein Bet [Syntrophomonadaceae bacterium]